MTFGKWALWSQHILRRASKVLQSHLSLLCSQLDKPGHSTCKIISWNFTLVIFKVKKMSSSTAEYRAWRQPLKTLSASLFSSPPPVCNSSLMSVWSHLVLMGRIECISLFAHVLLLHSSTECSITFSIAPSQKTEIIPKKQQPEVANPPAAVLAHVIRFSRQVWRYLTALAFKTKAGAKESALDLHYRR